MFGNNQGVPSLSMDSRMRLARNANDKSLINQPGSSRDFCIETDNYTNPNDNKRVASKRSASPSTDDSLADFKSPKCIDKPKKIVKLVPEKKKLKTRVNKKQTVSKKTNDNGQLSIESSFFKPIASANPCFLCPLCLKSFNDVAAQTNHSKNCAARNHVPTKKLLEAAQLQKRQAEERLKIGLPAGAFQQPRKKSVNLKNLIPEGDPDIHLALALSESLRDHQQRMEFDEAIALAAEDNEKILEMSHSQRKSTLQNFGFVTNKPIVEVIQKSRRRINLGSTTLQTRTQETRDRLLSDKISEVLIGTDKLTQKMVDENRIFDSESIVLNSAVLKVMNRPQHDLWSYSSAAKDHLQYYVKDLCPLIRPSVELKVQQSENKKQEKSENTMEKSPKQSEIDEEIIENEVVKIQRDENMCCWCNPLAQSWRKMVNSAVLSDILIVLKDNKNIYAHKLVLLTRCEQILQETRVNDESNSLQTSKIFWVDIDFAAAILFMELVYCGSIANFESLEDFNLVIEVEKLAKKYGCENFSDYISNKKIQMAQQNISPSSNNVPKAPKSSKSSVIEISEEENPQESLEIPETSTCLHNSRISISPDLFADMESFVEGSNDGPDAQQYSDVLSQPVQDEQSPIKSQVCPQNSPERVQNSVLLGSNDLLDLNNTPKSSLRYSATCPDPEVSESVKLQSTDKARSDLSLFIDKIRKKNAKGPLDSDSEDESPIGPVEKCRMNRFKIRNNSSFGIKYNFDVSKKEYDDERYKKSALSILEDEIRGKAAENLNKFDLIPKKFNDSSEKITKIIEKLTKGPIKSTESNSFTKIVATSEKISIEQLTSQEFDNTSDGIIKSAQNISQISPKSPDFDSNSSANSNLEADLENLSMYSNYRRTHRNNSIGDYRSLLKGFINQNPEGNKENFAMNSPGAHEISHINQLRLAELSAFDVFNSSAESPAEMSQNDLSKSQKSLELSQQLIVSPVALTQQLKGKDGDQEILKSQSCDKSYDLGLQEDLDFGDWSSEVSSHPLTQSVTEKKFPNNSKEKKNYVNNSFSSQENVNSIDLTQSDDEVACYRPSQTVTENVTRILKEAGLVDETFSDKLTTINTEKPRISSPIILSSESETGSPLKYVFSPRYDLDDDFVIEGGAESPLNIYCGQFSQPSTSQTGVSTQNVTFRKKTSLTVSKQAPRRSFHSISSNSDDEMENIIFSQSERSSEVIKDNSRLLKCKSNSEGNFAVRKTTFFGKKLENPPNQLKNVQIYNFLNIPMSSADIFAEVEPREDFEGLSSEELNKRLSDYGLRNQKRHRAIQLLDYIYNKIHPEIPDNLFMEMKESLSGNTKKIYSDYLNSRENNLDIEEQSSCSDSETKIELSEEEYDEREVQEVHECFQKLLNEAPELYNKILMFEPLGLENLYDILKEKGIKGGIKVLADYLDSECIAFFIEFPKKRDQTRSRGKKKKQTH